MTLHWIVASRTGYSRWSEYRIAFILLLFWQYSSAGIYSEPFTEHHQTNQQQQAADNRFAAWNQLIQKQRNAVIAEKLKATNDYFNGFYFEKDSGYQGITDYWKSPHAFINDGGGDCEDFVIAKYVTLRMLNVAAKSLRIAYVKSTKQKQAHMVLTYYANSEEEPLVLDNMMAEILPASQRPDLKPVYSFEGENLWLAKQGGQLYPIGEGPSLSSKLQTRDTSP